MWFENYPKMWEEHKDKDPYIEADNIGQVLKTKLGLPMCMMNPEQSAFFKRHYKADRVNKGPLVTEMEVIRQIEGW
jgi:hypothetical protein